MKKLPIYIVLAVIVLLVIYAFVSKDKKVEVVDNNPIVQGVGMCYQYSKENARGIADRAWLKMDIVGDRVTGEYQNLPAEKDKKTGKFSGTVGKMDPKISARLADVWWESSAEGMNVKEQLHITFGEGSAVALFGEMVDKGDGTYVYKDANKLTPGFQMSQVDCVVLDERVAVEQYVRGNIRTIAPEKEVLGGSWYVTSVNVNTSNKTGSMTYEDGHIEGSKNFSYVVDNGGVKINLVNKTTPVKPEDKPVACTMDAMMCSDGSYVGRSGPRCEFVCPR